MTTTNNPLLKDSAFPLFNKIQPQHVKPAIAQVLQQHRQNLKKI